ncbi:MAG: DUF2092 domain-containing protein [Cyclobacteriaceae bacterium]
MKSATTIFALLVVPFLAWSQSQPSDNTTQADQVALIILDRMSEVIGELKSCSFTLHTSQDVQDNTFFLPEEGLGLIKLFRKEEVHMVGPNKLLVNSNGDRGHRGYWYDGDQLAYYSYNENNYALVDAPPTILETIYAINNRYGVDFPAADFFNPYFTDDLLAQSEKLLFLGLSEVNEKECFHIVAASKEMSVQFWISTDAVTLPQKMVVVYLDQKGSPQYEATFADWELNPDLPDAIFNFFPPPGATELTLMPKDTTNSLP